MGKIKEKISKIIELMGFNRFQVEANEEERIISIIVEDGALSGDRLPDLVLNLNRITRLITKKDDLNPVIVDVNNYRREREKLIIELARAAARRAVATKMPVSLPAMNAYERRLIHTELSMRPDITTESIGEGKERYVIVKIIEI